ncbi:hypothetical protein CEXT_168001 [Caerostris extrusa]|uniref:Uncharacterized protein n=1 Tax=Caerostris extrusa TaxID=172846 RepID=A0AAV4VTA2_CAEEX|nr:hypothetical protein CEXT_168001 [Caerostris extrusa]
MVLQTDVSIYRNDNRNGDEGVISDTMWVLIVTFGARQSVVALSAGVTRLGVGVYSLRFGQSLNKYADSSTCSCRNLMLLNQLMSSLHGFSDWMEFSSIYCFDVVRY